MKNGKTMKRRDFLGIATWSIGGLISTALGIPAVVFIIGPARKSSKTQDWIRLGSTSKVEIGIPTLLKGKIKLQTGWITEELDLSAYNLTDNARDFVAISNICTHLACRVRWIADRKQFFCPCHNAIFDKEGNVVAGPPPRPLDRYEVKVEDGQLYMLNG
jgi:Rieske Fe-S protein